MSDTSRITKIAVSRYKRLKAYLEAAGVAGTDASAPLKRSNLSSRDPKPLGVVIDDFVLAADISAPLAVTGLTQNWAGIVGDEVATHVSIADFNEESGVLILETDSTAWATQLRMLIPVINSRIDEEIGPEVVREIVISGPNPPSWKFGQRRVPGRGPRDPYG